MDTNDFLYDVKIFSERLNNLRQEENNYTLENLSKKIAEKTGVNISHSQLGKYENPDKPERINANNLLAIAKFYAVSPEYLLGKSNSKKHDYTYQKTANKFSLSDKSMRNLSNLTSSKKYDSSSEFKIKLINLIIEDKLFIDILSDKLINYYKALENKLAIKDELKEQYGLPTLDIARSSLLKVFEDFAENNYNQLWYKEKPNFFEMPKRKRSNVNKAKKEDK